MRERIPWRRLAFEGLVIVVSILLAFAVQAWWEGLNEGHQRRTLLLGLTNDFDAAIADLERVSSLHVDGMLATARLMQLTDSGSLDQSQAAAVDSLLSAATLGGTFDPPLGTVETILGAGSLDVLDNDDLARELTSWPARVADLARVEQHMTDLLKDLLGTLSAHGVDASHLIWHDGFQGVPWEPGRTDSYRVVHQPDVRQLIGSLWFQYSNAVDKQEELRASWERMKPLLPN